MSGGPSSLALNNNPIQRQVPVAGSFSRCVTSYRHRESQRPIQDVGRLPLCSRPETISLPPLSFLNLSPRLSRARVAYCMPVSGAVCRSEEDSR